MAYGTGRVLTLERSILTIELTLQRRRDGYCGGDAEDDLVFGDNGQWW